MELFIRVPYVLCICGTCFQSLFSNTPEMCEGRVLFALLRGILAHRQTSFTPVKRQRSLPPTTVVAGR